MSSLSQKCTKLGKSLFVNNQIICSLTKLARSYSQNEGNVEGLHQFPVFSIKPNEGKFLLFKKA